MVFKYWWSDNETDILQLKTIKAWRKNVSCFDLDISLGEKNSIHR